MERYGVDEQRRMRTEDHVPFGRAVLGGVGSSNRLVPRCHGYIRIAYQRLHGTVREWSMLFLNEPLHDPCPDRGQPDQ